MSENRVFTTPSHYRVSWVGLTMILVVHLSAPFCPGRWKFARIGWAARQHGGRSKIEVNPTQVSDQMGHPVLDIMSVFDPSIIINQSLTMGWYCTLSVLYSFPPMMMGHSSTLSPCFLSAASKSALSLEPGM